MKKEKYEEKGNCESASVEQKSNVANESKAANAADNPAEEKLEEQQAGKEASEQAGEKCNKESGKLEEVTKRCEELNDKYLRLAADFDNYRRKSAQARIDLISTASEEVIKGLLPVLDDCQRALEALKNSSDADSAKEGTELIFNKLMTFLKSKGLESIEAIGKELDTDFHEAVAQFPTQDESKKNRIIDVTQQGYTLNGKVIRYAKVVVGI
ncbi:MAG: nucleotide exchange factor GrpE [Candidatus Egerieousia sp.]|nr:nucleotide exchange factor GrpE [Candidatus Egerieousia sp.]